MAGLTVDQLSASVDARLDNNSQNLLLWSGSFQTKLDSLGIGSINAFSGAISTSLTNLSSSVNATSTSFNARINSSNSNQTTLSASVSDDVSNLNSSIDGLNDFSASITSSFNSFSASVSSTSASFSTRINTLRLDAGGVSTTDFNALTQSLSGVISSSAQLNGTTITNLSITNLTTINETSSVIYSSGSNQFGDSLADNHILSGSVYIVGSGSLNGYTILTSNDTSSFLTSLNGALSSSAQVLNGSNVFSSSTQLPAGLVSASSQVLGGSNVFSSSAQLPTGLVSASSQILDGSGLFSASAQLPTGLVSASSQIEALGFITSSTSIATGSFATTGSNAFTGSQNINGDVIITGSTLSVMKSTDSDPFFNVDVNSKRLALVQGNGELPGEFYLALSGSSAFSPRPEKTLLYGARGFKFQTNPGTASEFTGSLVISSSAAVDLNVIGRLNVTGSLNVSSSNSFDWYMPEFSLYQRNASDYDKSGLTLNMWNNALGSYNSLQMYAWSGESWIQSTEKILKISGPTVQLSGLNSDPGNVNVIGALNVTGSMGISGSIVPAVGAGQSTSSFSLGSATNAWKDLWVSNGTINFLGGDGTPQGTLSSTATGLQLGSSTISGSMVVTGSLTIVNEAGIGSKVLSVEGIMGANYIAGNSGYLGIENGLTRSVQPVISSRFTNYYNSVTNIYKWEMSDLGIGTSYSWNYGRFTPSPAIRVGHNTDLSFYTGSSDNIYVPGFSTIISSNNNLSGLERNEAVAYSNGINHVLAVTGSLLSRDNTTLGTKATDLTYIRGAATISGSLMISGSLTTSGSVNMGQLNTIGNFGNLIVGDGNVATGSAGVVFGNGSSANGMFAVSMGSSLESDGQSSLAQGAGNKALENYTHAEGQMTTATGLGAHSEGSVTLASGDFAHSEGRLTTASADYSNAKGVGTIAAGVGQLAIGKYNIANNTTSLFVIGNGVDGSNRKDIVNVTTSSVNISGSLTVSSSAAVDVNVIGKMNVTGSLEVSSSNTLTWYTPKLDIYNSDPTDVCSFQLNKYDSTLGGYYNFTIRNNGDAGNGVWLTNGDQPIKIMTDDVITLGANNGETGSVKVIGSMTLAAQTVPTGTLVAGMMYFDSGTNEFKGYNGTTWVVLG